MRLMVVREGDVQSSFAVGVYHRSNSVFRCRRAFGECDGPLDAAIVGIDSEVACNGVRGSGCVLALLV